MYLSGTGCNASWRNFVNRRQLKQGEKEMAQSKVRKCVSQRKETEEKHRRTGGLDDVRTGRGV